MPLTHLRWVFRCRQFMTVLIVGNFVIVPLVIWALATLLLDDPNLQSGMFLVLLEPCADWLLIFGSPST